MILVIGYFAAVLIISLLLARRAKHPASIFLRSLVISIAGCAVYQLVNYVLNGLDPFMWLAVAVQLVGGFVVSAIATAVGFQRKPQQ